MRQLSTAVWLGCLVGCGVAEGTPPTAPPTDPIVLAPPVAPPVVPSPPAIVDPCSVHAAEFRAALASGTATCATDADCGCYSPVVEEAGCGGITSATTAARLQAIESAFHADHCPWPHLCGPWACVPICVEGRCANRPPSLGIGGS